MAKYFTQFSFHNLNTGAELVAGFGTYEPIETTEDEINQAVGEFSKLFANGRIESLVLYSPGDSEYTEIALPEAFIKNCFVVVTARKFCV